LKGSKLTKMKKAQHKAVHVQGGRYGAIGVKLNPPKRQPLGKLFYWSFIP